MQREESSNQMVFVVDANSLGMKVVKTDRCPVCQSDIVPIKKDGYHYCPNCGVEFESAYGSGGH